jgi:LPXTG-motif cell wall-anchored protein
VSGGTKTSGRPGAVKIVSVAPALARHPSGSPVGLIIGGIAVAGLAGAAGFIAVRRRRAD